MSAGMTNVRSAHKDSHLHILFNTHDLYFSLFKMIVDGHSLSLNVTIMRLSNQFVCKQTTSSTEVNEVILKENVFTFFCYKSTSDPITLTEIYTHRTKFKAKTKLSPLLDDWQVCSFHTPH